MYSLYMRQHCCVLTHWTINCFKTDVIASVKATIHVYPALQWMKTKSVSETLRMKITLTIFSPTG